MRCVSICFLLFSGLSLQTLALPMHDDDLDQETIDALTERAMQAAPKDQCILYAELVQATVEFGARQYANGKVDEAKRLLRQAQAFTKKIRSALAVNDNKLKKIQILLRRSAFRLSQLFQASDPDDRSIIKQTLTQLDEAQRDAMLQVFRK